VHDYKGVSLFRDAQVKAISKELIDIFKDHYPELLYKKYFCNVPKVMEFLFNTVGLLVPKKTREKFVLVGAGGLKSALLENISADQLPPCYGGFGSVSGDQEKDTIQEVIVPARSSKKLEWKVEVNETIEWDYVVKANDIGVSFGLLDHENQGTLCPMAREEGGKGSLKADKVGTFVLEFNNEYSLLTEKIVIHRVVVRK
jgi:hypothetical protein